MCGFGGSCGRTAADRRSENYFLALGRGEREQAAVLAVGVGAESLLDHRLDLVVRMHRIMMEERELARARLARHQERVLKAGVPPTDVVAVLLGAVLGVMDQQVGIPAPIDVA